MQLNNPIIQRKLSLSSVSGGFLFPVLNIGSAASIPTYYLILSITLCIAMMWLYRRTLDKDLSPQISLDLSLILMISGFIGGRALHVFYEEPNYYLEDPWKVLEFWNGGFVFYGGALLAGFCGVLYLRRKASSQIFDYLDLIAPVAAFTYSLGRVACLFAGCCYGKYCELPWAISGRHPTQLYASLWEAGVIFILFGLESKKQKTGTVFFSWLTLHGAGRFIMELYRDDFRGPSYPLSISSWISLALICFGILCLVLRQRKA